MALHVANKFLILQQEQVRVEDVSVILAKTFFCLLLYGQHLPACLRDRRSEALALCCHVRGRDSPSVNSLGAIVHSEHLPDHNAFGNSEPQEAKFLS